YKDNKFLTKEMEYDTTTKEIVADGRIDITNKDSVMDTQKLVINTETERASLGEINVKFGKNSYAKAESADMKNPNKIVLNDVEYTACKEGLNECSNPPTWKIGAGSVTHNRETGSLFYTNALLYLWDIPVFYLPILQNYTPNIKNKTGLLIPKFGTSSTLGNVLQVPFFIKLNDYNDMTISPMFTSKKGTIWFGEYRTNQDYFTSVTSGSYKKKDEDSGEDKRWYINTKNYFELNDIWHGKVDIERVSDDSYLRSYNFNTDPWLSSNIELEGALNRSYLTMDMYFYQSLRSSYTYTPKVMPIINYERVSEPNSNGGYWSLNLNTSHIVLDYNDPLRKDETNFRTSSILRYSQPFKTSGGHLINLGIEGRGDLFVLDDIQDSEQSSGYYSGSTGRANISTDLTWKYPLYRSYANRTEILEPTIQFIASPKQPYDSSIPNMDSSYLELQSENLFSTDRFSGYDLFESGVRVNYGLNFVQNYNNNEKISFFIGQNYNINVPDDLYIENSGLKNIKGASDIVSNIAYTPSSFFSIYYKTRLSQSDFKANRNDVGLHIGPKALSLNLNYVYLRNMYIEDDNDSVKSDELYTYISSQLTRSWRAFIGNRYDLDNRRNIKLLSGLEYENDCFKFNINLVNDYTRDKDYEGDKSIYFTLVFKTLGAVSTSFGVSGDNN
ncbi:MAG: LPS assembly protein LptD, partial [bacterium]|nr:LPS assembly protein LptD [bacterium]